jgi:hypothetical protein
MYVEDVNAESVQEGNAQEENADMTDVGCARKNQFGKNVGRETTPQPYLSDEAFYETLRVGGVINYYSAIDVHGTPGKQKSGLVVEILSPSELFLPHLILDNSESINFGAIIQRAKEHINGEYKSINSGWFGSDKFTYTPGKINGALRESLKRLADQFKDIVLAARQDADDSYDKK